MSGSSCIVIELRSFSVFPLANWGVGSVSLHGKYVRTHWPHPGRHGLGDEDGPYLSACRERVFPHVAFLFFSSEDGERTCKSTA